MLEGKTIVVTGAAHGIGAEVARVIKARGADVVGVDLEEVTENVVRSVRVDLSDLAAIEKAIREIGAGANGLANVAGLPPTAGRGAVLRVNFLGLRALTEGLLPGLTENASIVNLASLAGAGWPERGALCNQFIEEGTFENVETFCDEHGIDDGQSYFFSKETLVVWTMHNRWAWRDRGIRMNCVSPGPVETRILPDFLATLGERAEEDRKVMDRPGRPEDVAPLVAFLLSDGAEWIRGANLPVDGGMSSHIAMNMNELE